MPQSVVEILDRLTDPTERAVAVLRQTIDDLAGEILTLKSATDDKGEDDRDFLCYLAVEAADALDHLAEVIEERRR
jgi:hypothetical protein